MKKEFYITLCVLLPCCIMGIQWYKSGILTEAQKQNQQLCATQKHLLRQKTELEQAIVVAYDTIKQFASHELNMAPIKDKQIRTLPS